MFQQVVSQIGEGTGCGVAAGHQKEEGFINKMLVLWDLVASLQIRLKEKVEHRVSAVFGLCKTFLASRLDPLYPLRTLLVVRQFIVHICFLRFVFLANLKLIYPGATISASDKGKLRAIFCRIGKCLASPMWFVNMSMLVRKSGYMSFSSFAVKFCVWPNKDFEITSTCVECQ